MVALSASRLVWPAMSLISLTTSPMRCAAASSARTCSLVLSACAAASLAMRALSPTWRPISVVDDESSSAAEATACTPVVAWPTAPLAVAAWRCVSWALAVIALAELWSSPDALASRVTTPPTLASNEEASVAMVERFSCSACCFVAASRCAAARDSISGVTEGRECCDQHADLVAAGARQGGVEVAAGDRAHAAGEGVEARQHAPADIEPGDQHRDDQRDRGKDREQGDAAADRLVRLRRGRAVGALGLGDDRIDRARPVDAQARGSRRAPLACGRAARAPARAGGRSCSPPEPKAITASARA
jgi:hypothetical protein